MLKPSRPAVVALLLAVPSLGVKMWDWLDRSNGLDIWLKANGSTPLGQFVNEVLSVGWLFLFVGLLFWYHDSRGRQARTADLSSGPSVPIPPTHVSETDALKRKIAEQTDEVYLAKTERDDMRRERDALKEKCDRVSGELETVQSTAQSQQRALLQDLGDRMSQADSQKLLGELVDARTERDAALADKAAIVKSLPAPPREALLRGEVARFEMLDFNLVIKHQLASFERQHGRGVTTLEYIQSGIGTHGIVYYAAWLKLEATTQTKAADWTATVLHKDGALLTCEFVATDWGRPDSWPPIEYRSSSDVQNMTLQPRELYNVLVHIRCQLPDVQVNMNSFTARFLDDNRTEVVCSMKQPGAYK